MAEDVKVAVADSIGRIENRRISSGRPDESPTHGNGLGAELSETESDRISEDTRQLVSDVLIDLERMIVSDDWLHVGDKENVDEKAKHRKVFLPSLDQLGRSVITSYSLKQYAELLAPHHRSSIANFLYQNSALTLNKLFRSQDATVIFHTEQFEGLLRVVRIALHIKYPNLVNSGYSQFSERPPVVYVSANVCYGGIEQFFSFELGLSEVRTIPAVKGRVGFEPMDLSVLTEQLEQDTATGKVPVLLIASTGSHMLGVSDNIEALAKLKEKYSFWLHVDGYNYASLCLAEQTEANEKLRQSCDSLFVSLGQWLGIPAVPYITIHKSVEFIRPNYVEKLAAMPWWVVTKHMGHELISERIQHCFILTNAMMNAVTKYPDLCLLSSSNPIQQQKKTAPKKGELAPPLLLLQYRFPKQYLVSKAKSGSPGDAAAAEVKQHEFDVFSEHYLDAINTWIGQGLCSECRPLGLQLVNVQDFGVCTRYCALETANTLRTSIEHVNKFANQLGQVMAIVDSTVRARATFCETVSRFTGLRPAEIHKWAGVGAVIYVPAMLREVSEWNDKQKQQVSHLNIELVHVLRNNDHAFSLGESTFGLSCVKFGMLANAEDLVDLVSLVAKVGKEIEESSKYIETMAEWVRQGIDAANEDLKKENENRLMQEGVLRQVPLVGSVLNWFAPLPKETVNTRGRTFDLVSGQIVSTETVYQRRLQMKHGEGSSDDVAVPMTPAQLHGNASFEDQNGTQVGQNGAPIPTDKETHETRAS